MFESKRFLNEYMKEKRTVCGKKKILAKLKNFKLLEL